MGKTQSSLKLNIEGVVTIAGDLYVKTPEALEALLAHLRGLGYTIDNLRESESREKDGVTVQQMEKRGWSLWFAHLADLRRAKCGTCGSYISTSGTRMHGHRCEACGAVVYYDLIDGSSVTFRFNPEAREYERNFLAPRIKATVHKWDVEAGYLYLYADSMQADGLFATPESKDEYLRQHLTMFSVVTIKGVGRDLIRVKYSQPWNSSEDQIEPTDSSGHMWNHKIVKLFDGKEYGEWDHLPIPETFSIFETWHWAPLEPTPRLHERLLSAIHQVADQGYYYQDGRAAFNVQHWHEIGVFIHHFTTLNSAAYQTASLRFRMDGPGGIADLARFCHEHAVVQNKPNIGNALIGFTKSMSGQPMTQQEKDAAEAGMPQFKSLLLGEESSEEE